MLGWLEQFLIRYPELALFLVIAVLFLFGNIVPRQKGVMTAADVQDWRALAGPHWAASADNEEG